MMVKVKTKAKVAAVTLSLGPLLGWGGAEIYQLKQESVENRVKIEALKETVEEHRESQQELIKLHLVLK